MCYFIPYKLCKYSFISATFELAPFRIGRIGSGTQTTSMTIYKLYYNNSHISYRLSGSRGVSNVLGRSLSSRNHFAFYHPPAPQSQMEIMQFQSRIKIAAAHSHTVSVPKQAVTVEMQQENQ